uniref:4Fe-4S ferredoxin-type domain-containing protein n=1 Tax=Ignisphaera aggregans TaxID=334771 RepID=A0A7C4BC70_9CREN
MKTNTIAWVVTGGGAYLRECVSVLEYVKERFELKITLFLTKWGYEVARIFGVLPRLRSVSPGGYYEEFLISDEGMYYVGRINVGRYRALVIAPATANTIAKIVHGIADTVATALFAQAGKSSVPTIVLPTDIPNEEGHIITETPCYIDRAVCSSVNCNPCQLINKCSTKAIEVIDRWPRIDLNKCTGCALCEKLCPYGAVRCWEKIKLIPRPIDLENIEELTKMRNVIVVKSPWEIVEKIEMLLSKS